MIFLLEDMPDRIMWFRRHWHKMMHASNPPAALEILRSKAHHFGTIFLDHDLVDFESDECMGDGIIVARALANERLHTDAKVFIHAGNPVGAQNMENALRDTHEVYRIPFPKLRENVEREMTKVNYLQETENG